MSAKTGSDNQRRGKKDRARRANVKHIPFPHTPASRPGNQVARHAPRMVQNQFKKFSRASQCVRQTLEYSSSEIF
jgi:hypothetical protein